MNEEVKINVMKGIRKALDRVSKKWWSMMRVNCPVDEGLMRESIMIENVKPDGSFSIRTNTSYASFVEEGTGVMVRAHGVHDPKNPVTDWKAKRKRGSENPSTLPFMVPVVYSTKDWFGKVLAEEIRRSFE